MTNNFTVPGTPPKKPASVALGESAGRAIVGMVPGGGPALQEILTNAVDSPFRARMHGWLTEVATAIAELQAAHRCPGWDKLASDERFLDVLGRATRAAQTTERTQKRRALRHAVMNSASGASPGEDLELRFIGIVDDSIPAHFDLLLHLGNPPRAFALARKPWDASVDEYEQNLPWGYAAEPPLSTYLHYMRSQLLDDLLSMFSEPRDVTARLSKDLESWQLLDLGPRHMKAGFVSPLGDSLLKYVDVNEATAAAFERFGEANS